MLTAAFVSETSSALRFRTLSLRTAEIMGLLQAAAESACEHAGGAAYRTVRETADAAEDDYLRTITRTSHCEHRLAERERCQSALAEFRARFSAEARVAQRQCARRYWTDQSQHWLTDDLLAHLRADHPLRGLAEFIPAWWQLFLTCLRHEFSRCHIPAFHLLDELPNLRRLAHVKRGKILAAIVDEWRESRADELGLPVQLHHHVVARRGLACGPIRG